MSSMIYDQQVGIAAQNRAINDRNQGVSSFRIIKCVRQNARKRFPLLGILMPWLR